MTYPISDVLYLNKGTHFSIVNNIHLMHNVSNFHCGLRKQRHLNFHMKQNSLMHNVSNFRGVYVNKGTHFPIVNNIHLMHNVSNFRGGLR